MNVVSLQERRQAASDQLEELRRQRGRTILEDGQRFDPKLNLSIAEKEFEIAAIAEAEVEITHRERERMSRAEMDRRSALIADLKSAEATRINAVECAERAARELATALTEVLERCRDIRDAVQKLNGRHDLALDQAELEKRLSHRLSRTLSGVGLVPSVFGDITLHTAPYVDPTASWSDLESAEGRKALQQYIQGEIP